MKTAFSLVELLVVIVIVSLLTIISVPNFLRWQEKARLNSFVRNLSSVVGMIRDYSRYSGERVILAITTSFPRDGWLNGEKDVIYLAFVDKNKSGIFDSNDSVLSVGSASGIEVVKNTVGHSCFNGTAKCLIFFPVGLPMIGAVPGEIEFKGKGGSVCTMTFRSVTGIVEVKCE